MVVHEIEITTGIVLTGDVIRTDHHTIVDAAGTTTGQETSTLTI